MSNLIATTTQDRFNDAIKSARGLMKDNNISIKQNVYACCISCVEVENAVWSFRGQGMGYTWYNGEAVKYGKKSVLSKRRSGYSSVGRFKVNSVYFYFTSDAFRVIPFFVQVFRNNGFNVEWDGSESTAVLIKL